MEKVTSRDGTRIAYHRRGAGPPLVLVPGMGGVNQLVWPALPVLAARYTVCAMERRGHGASGDGPAYSLAREAEDLAAVVDAQGARTSLFGHSFGALCALEATLLAQNIHKLILYEPGFPVGGAPVLAPGTIERYEALLAAGDREGVLVLFYGEVVGLSPVEVNAMRALPAWQERLALAHTLPREMRAEEDYVFDAGRFQALKAPTLLITGEDSPEFLAAPTRALHAALPHSRLAVLPGQQHIAMYTAPELFAQTLLEFLDAP